MPASNPRIDELRKKFDENPRRYFAPLANEYRKAGDLDQAIEICRTHLKEQPTHMSGHVVFGQALYEANQFEEGRTVFEAALQLDPENLIALRHLGDIERELSNPSKARGWYQRVLDADPRNEEIQAQLAALPPDPVAEEPGEAPAHAPAEEEDDILGAMDWSDVATPAPPVQGVSADATTAVMDRPQLPTPEAAPEPEPMALDLRDSSAGMPAIEEQSPVAGLPAAEGFETTHFDPGEQREEAPGPLAGLSGNFGTAHDPAHDTVEEAVPLAFDPGATAQMPSLDRDVTAQIPAVDLGATAQMPPMDLSVPAAEHDPTDTPEHRRASVDSMMAWKTPTSVTPMSSTPVSSGAVDPLLDDSFAEFTPPTGVPVQSSVPREPEPAPAPEPVEELVMEPMSEASAIEMAPPAEAQEIELVPEVAAGDVTEAPGAFVTETMAELYVKQGLIEHAISVYQQLVQQAPGDARLQARLDQLEGRPAADVVPEDLSLTRESATPGWDAPAEPRRAAEVPRGPSMRELLERIAFTRLGLEGWAPQAQPAATEAEPEREPMAEATPEPEWTAPAAVAPEYEAPQPETAFEPPAPPETRSPVQASSETDTISATFGGRGVRVEDEAAALALSTLFANGDAPSVTPIAGKPTRAATDEFSLDRVFSDSPRRSAELRRSQGFSFDQFFSDGSGPAKPGVQASSAEPREADIAQFNSWLEGLKKK